MSTEPIVTPSKFTPCVSPRTNVTLSMEPVLKPLELTPCVSSSPQITMVSRFIDHKLSDRKAGSKGISVEEEENEEVEEEASKDETKIQVDAELTQDIGWLLPIFLRAHAEPWRILYVKDGSLG
ncbi:hypothetical protein Tco_0125992 [Tanacetum coccineum]